MSDTKSLNTSLLEVMISSKDELGSLHDFSYITLQILLDAWWASMNGHLKRPIAWDNFRHALSW